jgi:NTP pyrophosphatase (non-canonical NTP hydrolase)
MSEKTIKHLKEELKKFADERDWAQFHSPKNLVMALVGEVGELCAEFQWRNENQSRNLTADELAAIREEMGDVLIYLVRLADQLDVDLLECGFEKLRINNEKYPADLVRGSAKKYTKYGKEN